MTRSIIAAVFVGLLTVGHAVFAQDIALQAQSANAPSVAQVTFTRNLWGVSPGYYSITITSAGNMIYRSTPNSDQKTGEPYMLEFLASDSTRLKVFQIVQQLNFLQGKFRIRQSNKSNAATNKLTFADGVIENQIAYTSAKDPCIRQLTVLFENISATLEFGRRLDLLRRSNPAGLTAELRRLERMSRQGRCVEFQAVAPVVRQIASDAALPEVSRRYARAILKDSGIEASRSRQPEQDHGS